MPSHKTQTNVKEPTHSSRRVGQGVVRPSIYLKVGCCVPPEMTRLQNQTRGVVTYIQVLGVKGEQQQNNISWQFTAGTLPPSVV